MDAVERRTPWPHREQRLLALASSLNLTDPADEALYAEGLRFFDRQWASTGARAARSHDAEAAARKEAQQLQQQEQAGAVAACVAEPRPKVGGRPVDKGGGKAAGRHVGG